MSKLVVPDHIEVPVKLMAQEVAEFDKYEHAVFLLYNKESGGISFWYDSGIELHLLMAMCTQLNYEVHQMIHDQRMCEDDDGEVALAIVKKEPATILPFKQG